MTLRQRRLGRLHVASTINLMRHRDRYAKSVRSLRSLAQACPCRSCCTVQAFLKRDLGHSSRQITVNGGINGLTKGRLLSSPSTIPTSFPSVVGARPPTWFVPAEVPKGDVSQPIRVFNSTLPLSLSSCCAHPPFPLLSPCCLTFRLSDYVPQCSTNAQAGRPERSYHCR